MAGTFNVSDMELTPAQVYFTPAGSTTEYYVGGTLSNVKVAFSYDKADIKADQTGDTPLDKRIKGVKCTVTTEITQVNDFQLFNLLYPHSTLVGGTPFDGASPSAAIDWTNQVGASDISVAGNLRLHPQNRAAAATSYDWNFAKAVATEATEVVYGPSEQSRLKVEWTIYPNTAVTPFKFFRFGNLSF